MGINGLMENSILARVRARKEKVMKYDQLLNEVENIAKLHGRNPSEITTIAVSKGYPWQHVASAYDEGCRNFGESRIQEALPKISDAPKDIRWHFIGTLQKNKVRSAIQHFTLIHSVDTFELAQKISQCSAETGIETSILLQINTSGESSKHGLSTQQWEQVIELLLKLPALHVEGLMTIAPYTNDEKPIRQCFSNLRQFRDRLRILTGKLLSHLSMGMSHDYPYAIAEGATLLRIGSALFDNIH